VAAWNGFPPLRSLFFLQVVIWEVFFFFNISRCEPCLFFPFSVVVVAPSEGCYNMVFSRVWGTIRALFLVTVLARSVTSGGRLVPDDTSFNILRFFFFFVRSVSPRGRSAGDPDRPNGHFAAFFFSTPLPPSP